MGKKQNPFNTHSIEQAAEDYIREIDFRMQQRGITSAEAIAEIQAEEQMKEEAAIYVRLVFQLPLTVFVVYKKRKGVLDFISQALRGASFELVSLSEMSDMKALWKRLLSADPQKVWVINEVEQVVDVALQSVIHAMLQREKYAPVGFPAIDFGIIRLVLLGEAGCMPVCFEDISSFENAIEVTL